MSSATYINVYAFSGDAVYARDVDRVAEPLGEASSTSGSGRLRISSFGAFAAPFALMAAFAAPAPPSIYRRTFSGGQGIVSRAIELDWRSHDAWEYSEAHVSQHEIDALNRLYRLSPSEGFSLELPDA
jgi:hypothetical protein